MQKKKWLNAFWRWFLEAIDRKDWKLALRLADTIEKTQKRN